MRLFGCYYHISVTVHLIYLTLGRFVAEEKKEVQCLIQSRNTEQLTPFCRGMASVALQEVTQLMHDIMGKQTQTQRRLARCNYYVPAREKNKSRRLMSLGAWGDAVNMGFIYLRRILISGVQLGKYQCIIQILEYRWPIKHYL